MIDGVIGDDGDVAVARSRVDGAGRRHENGVIGGSLGIRVMVAGDTGRGGRQQSWRHKKGLACTSRGLES